MKNKNIDCNNTILIAGSSGFIGRKLVKTLSKSNNIVSLYHERLPDPMPNVFPVCNDLNSVDLLAAPLRGVNTAIYLAWDNNVIKDKDSYESFNENIFSESKNLMHFKNFVEACEKASIEKVIFMSSLGAHRFSRHKFLQEKYLAEHILLNSKIKHSCIIRSPFLYSTDGSDRFFNSLKNLVNTPIFIPKPRLKKPLHICHVDELVSILASISNANNFESVFVYEIEGEVVSNFSEILRLLKNNQLNKPKLLLSGELGHCVFSLMEKFYSRSSDHEISLGEILKLPMGLDDYLKWEPGVYGFEKNISFRNMIDTLKQIA